MYEYDTSLVFFPLDLMRNFLNKGNIDHYEILADDFIDLDYSKSAISNLIPSYFKILIGGLNPTLFNAIEVERNVMF